jgi:hypothetical protein
MKRAKLDTLITSGFMFPMVFEMILCLICCPPGLDIEYAGFVLKGMFIYSIDSLLFVLKLSKCYLFLRVWLHYSMWNNDFAKKKCRKYKVQTGYLFSIKAELNARPLRFLIVSYIFMILIGGLSIRTLET